MGGLIIMNIVDQFVWEHSKKMDFPVRVGDSLDVHVRLKEAGKERVQVFSGVVLKIQGGKAGRSFTVRKIASGVGVERTFPLNSPAVEKIEVTSRAKVRRARLFYLRGRSGRSARLRSATTDLANKTSTTSANKNTSKSAIKSPSKSPSKSASKNTVNTKTANKSSAKAKTTNKSKSINTKTKNKESLQ